MRAAIGLFAVPRFRVVVVIACTLAVVTVSDSFVYLVARESAGADMSFFPIFYVATPFCYFLLAGPVGAIADRVGSATTFVAGHSALLMLYAVLVQPAFGPIAPLISIVMLGVYYAATDGVLAALVSATVPAQVRSSGLAIVATGTSLGRFFASMTFGAVWSLWGKDIAVLVFAVALATSLAPALAFFRGIDRRMNTDA